MFTAARILDSDPNCDLTMIAPKDRKNGASKAAGLMLNIFSEIDAISYDMPLTKWKLKNWSKALDKWNNFFSPEGIVLNKEIYSSLGTKIYFDKNSSNNLERMSYEKLKEISANYKVSNKTENDDNIFLPYEHSVDSRRVLKTLDDFVSAKSKLINDYVDKIKVFKNNIKVFTKLNSQEFNFEKVILAAGSKSTEILRNSELDFNLDNIPVCLNGIGTALEFFTELDYVKEHKTEFILRSPNRRGTCGIHMVQRTNSIYVGASSVVSDKNLNYPRLGSVETLLKGLKNELGLSDLVRQSLNILSGYRPVSQDAVPIFGAIDSNLFLSYGHKRDGFTWAPYLSEIINNWIMHRDNNSEDNNYLSMCNPLREKFNCFGSYEKSKDLYLLNEEFSYAQHNEEYNERIKNNLIDRFEKLHKTKEFSNSVCHPELVNINYYLLNKDN